MALSILDPPTDAEGSDNSPSMLAVTRYAGWCQCPEIVNITYLCVCVCVDFS